MTLTLFLVIIVSFFITYCLTPLTISFFKSRGWLENPSEKQKKSGNATALAVLPRGGGFPIFIGILITSLLFLPLDKHLLGILISGFVALLVGLWDDIKDINPKLRLFTNLLSALIVVGFGIGIAYLSNPFGGTLDLSLPQYTFYLFGQSHSIWIFSDILAIFWIMWCMNIVGWSSGVEGQLPGFVAISAFFIGIVGLRYSSDISEWPVIILSFAVAGAYLGFLPWNFFPQRIMPGYSGKSLAGFFLAVLSVLSGAKLATLAFLLAIPMIDALFVLISRLVSHRSLFSSDNAHLHHYLLKKKWTRQGIAIFYWLFSLSLGLISLLLDSQQKFVLFIILLIFFFFIAFKSSRHI
jgi:UDP-GlcNAc:undecaprenyl-phosphate GlcNAc-1-phosphate transferase